jgi:hypothetical protein
MEWMIPFMGWFLITVGILKILDWKRFSKNFSKYDLIAMKSSLYSKSYPLIELVIGGAFLYSWNIKIIAGVLLALMIVGIVGVSNALKENKKITCACLGKLGHHLNIPLTKLTLMENIIMSLMAIAILLL